MEIRIEVDAGSAKQAFAAAPGVLERHLDQGTHRAAEELAREARALAPKAFSTLVQSIRTGRVGPAHYQVATGVAYARFMEEGVRPGKIPPGVALEPWVKRVLGKQGEEARQTAFLIARAIGRRGIAPRRFMAQAVEAKRSRVIELVEQAVDRGLAEAFGA